MTSGGEKNPDKDEPNLPRTESDPEGLEPGPSGPPPNPRRGRGGRAARRYIEAIADRDGERLCAAFEPSADEPQQRLEVPQLSSCAASFDASFGFEGKDGQPVWADLGDDRADVSAQIDGDQARVVATVFTKYSDVREPTIEDDIIYLSGATDRWLVVKPSATLIPGRWDRRHPVWKPLEPPGPLALDGLDVRGRREPFSTV